MKKTILNSLKEDAQQRLVKYFNWKYNKDFWKYTKRKNDTESIENSKKDWYINPVEINNELIDNLIDSFERCFSKN